jgi:hypothetical protein
LGKVEKVYLDNPNLIYFLSAKDPEIGHVRETFFINQMRVNNTLASSSVADFKIDKYTFEVGGKSKSQEQIKNTSDAFIVKDDIPIYRDNRHSETPQHPGQGPAPMGVQARRRRLQLLDAEHQCRSGTGQKMQPAFFCVTLREIDIYIRTF